MLVLPASPAAAAGCWVQTPVPVGLQPLDIEVGADGSVWSMGSVGPSLDFRLFRRVGGGWQESPTQDPVAGVGSFDIAADGRNPGRALIWRSLNANGTIEAWINGQWVRDTQRVGAGMAVNPQGQPWTIYTRVGQGSSIHRYAC